MVKAGSKALADDDGQKQQLQRLAEETPAMRAAAEKYAQRVLVRQEVLLRLFKPLARLVGVSREYFDGDFAIDLAEKVAEIPEEHLRSPAASVAIPAMEGLRYSLDDPDLKEMYLSLLAAATDDRRDGDAHPAFAEAIKQLSPAEAPFLRLCLSAGEVPAVQLRRSFASGGWDVLQNHLCNWLRGGVPVDAPLAPVYVDNWERLGLVRSDYIIRLEAEDVYGWVEARPEFANAAYQHDVMHSAGRYPPGSKVGFERGYLEVTDYGKRFAAAIGIEAGEGDANLELD